MKSKSFYPNKPIRVPTDVTFEDWQSSVVNADFLVFGMFSSWAAARS